MIRRAFTLIEVLTVLLILIITVGVGYVSLSSATKSSYSQIAQGYATQVTGAEENFYNQYGTFTPYPSDLSGISTPLVVTGSAVTGPSQVSIAVGQTTGALALAYLDGSSACQIELVAPPVTATTSGATTTLPTVPTNTSCVASLALQSESPVVTTTGGTAK